MKNSRILIIAEEVSVRRSLEELFERSGAQVFVATALRDGLQKLYAHQPDLVVLEMQLPDLDGLKVCRRIRLFTELPIIIYSTDADEALELQALEMGADDYLTKPFSPDVLLARIRTALRKAINDHRLRQWQLSYQDDHITIDLSQQRVLVDGKPVGLTKTEYRLMGYLLRNAGRVLSIDRILENVWGTGYRESTASVHVYISRLRKKIEKDPQQPRYLHSEYGRGYRFEDPSEKT